MPLIPRPYIKRMKYPVDLSLFNTKAHNPSYASVVRSLGDNSQSIVDFCIPCNPYFPTEAMFDSWAGELEQILKYYPTDSATLGDSVAELVNLDPASLVLGNGSTELLTFIDLLFVKESLATPIPTFGRWTDQPQETGKKLHLFPLHGRNNFTFDPDAFIAFVHESQARVAVICNPNNPTGGYLPRREIIRMVQAFSHLDLVVIDESFIDFVEAEKEASVAAFAATSDNVIVLKSLGKNFGLHGVRFGYTVSNPHLAGRLRLALPRWNVNSIAEKIILSLKAHRTEYQESLAQIFLDRKMMFKSLSALTQLKVFPSEANFLLVRLPYGVSGEDCRNFLISEHGVFIRECGNKIGMSSQFLRVVCRPQNEVKRLTDGLTAFLRSVSVPTEKHTDDYGLLSAS